MRWARALAVLATALLAVGLYGRYTHDPLRVATARNMLAPGAVEVLAEAFEALGSLSLDAVEGVGDALNAPANETPEAKRERFARSPASARQAKIETPEGRRARDDARRARYDAYLRSFFASSQVDESLKTLVSTTCGSTRQDDPQACCLVGTTALDIRQKEEERRYLDFTRVAFASAMPAAAALLVGLVGLVRRFRRGRLRA